MISTIISIIYCLPLFLFFFFITFRKLNERTITSISTANSILNLTISIFLIFVFIENNFQDIEVSLGKIFLSGHSFNFNFFIDELTLNVLITSGFLLLVINRFSQSYLHRERGFVRYYATINLFTFGIQLLSFAGTLDLFFAGWEIVGLCSFILIGFYHNRTRVVKNAFRIFSIYRLCDVGLLLSAILTHKVSKKADQFLYYINQEHLPVEAIEPWLGSLTIGLIILASVGKSAQFPFFNWPARAMEGPTPSSAIFYGALSIHGGAILIYRMLPLIQQYSWAQNFIFLIGFVTFLLASIVSKTQSNIKGYLAYLSVRQVSMMYMELALGLKEIFLMHFLIHALFRCYQILISPSVVIEHTKSLNFETISKSNEIQKASKWFKKLYASFYMFSFQEAFLSNTERGFFPLPLIRFKKWVQKYKHLFWIFITLYLFMIHFFSNPKTGGFITLAHALAALDVIICIYCLTSYKSAQKIWDYFFFSQLLFILANFTLDPHTLEGIKLYLFSAIPLYLMGMYSLKSIPEEISMSRFNGLSLIYRKQYYMFFISFIGLSGYPFTTIFWAEDILFSEIMLKDPLVLIMTSLSLTLNGLIAGRILIKTFWGYPSIQRF